MFIIKKIFICIVLLVLSVPCFVGCVNKAEPSGTISITENTFAEQIIEINENPTSYIEKTIKIEGLCRIDKHSEHSHYYVCRNSSVYDHDHGHNHTEKIGFEFNYSGNMPKENDWIEVVGTLRIYSETGHTSLVIVADSVTILDKRGEETIIQ